MANVLLIDVLGWQGDVLNKSPFPNVGIAYLSSSLKAAGHEVIVADMNNVSMNGEDILRLIEERNCNIIGMSLKTSTVAEARRLGLFLREHTSVPIVLGGPHVTILAEGLLAEPWVDFVFAGEAEETFPSFCNDLSRPGDNKLPGLRTKAGDQTSPHLVSDLDQLLFPDYGVFSWVVNAPHAFNYPLVTSRGCVFNCTYCSVPNISGKKFRKRDPHAIIAELRSAQETFGIEEFSIIDDSFNLDMDRAKEFCFLVQKSGLGLRWSCPNGIRADMIDPELARLMKVSGCHSVMVGIESADPAILKTVKKGESLNDIIRGIKCLKDAGLSVGGYFLIGLPGDSFKSQRRSVEFARKYGISAHFNMLVPYPGTELNDWVQEHGLLLRSVEESVHFSDCSDSVQPTFETADFSAKERIKAYEMVHTRMARFDMLIPKSIEGKVKGRYEIFKFLLKYDKLQLLKRLIYNFFPVGG